ncbi:D-alanyl-D-alanine carboxypeptidase/D-alanyl-D-alanine endopeptidase [Pseudobacter ginsenosidimutans]|uniref:D-alanyl-D-alanine carboxypeptidase/D-alanyl-D-alanine-endopeptidase (Penicillin-binding protein 4) n=1 Tax=Pseudobacter ginsenosidimutans TaxID=661488 RepID=A0A4Q7MK32_9BACT|nr:D-alanyl-D-alanine carboxypeptidase/D-alanyl-D-alanine-endopeptidase [Pseudobacter ginsenosidimutans]QEC45401.1 D-alanyl-D-alanine carboxypeptidase/D-alanyl-D-alanine-endopeptidase [Pseudobacter ginsenosidimutans]RZS66929.1 D-alanyl-D-alanine carboxypeptidase/D-alanyl-D-alanine-endopeptidase (penicillin-binding protein 4) [Pseudobacter ginsenosidimutans]
MKKILYVAFLLNLCVQVNAQSVAQKLEETIVQLEADPAFKHAIISLCVVNTTTGEQVFGRQEQTGLAPASTQKLFTSAAAYELLGQQFRFYTRIARDQPVQQGVLNGDLFVVGGGDPTAGSWRWAATKEKAIMDEIISILHKHKIHTIKGNIWIDDHSYTQDPLPGGWIWTDMGNYYGAGCWGINWHENQYDLTLSAGDCCGGLTTVKNISPSIPNLQLINDIRVGKQGSGDNGYIFAAPYSSRAFTSGTIPANEKSFTISGSMPHPGLVFGETLKSKMVQGGIKFSGKVQTASGAYLSGQPLRKPTAVLDSIASPTFDSINYWFLQKSVNLFGEALLKRIAFEKNGNGNTDDGASLLRNFWQERGIEKGAINIMDGSGLSPQNRVTTDALVRVLQFAKGRPWYNSFYYSLPLYNGMKMKSGSIGGSRAFAGYHTAKDGTKYSFAIIINNYNGGSGETVKKIYKVLDVLK